MLIELAWEVRGIELGRDHDGAELIGQRACMVAIGAGIAIDAMEDHEQHPARNRGV